MHRSFPAAELLERIADNADLMSLGSSVSRVAELADTETSTLSELANLILSDLNLTQKVLRLANSVMFRSIGGPVTTVSRAIARIGSDQVRILALSSLLLERMSDRDNAALLSPELMQALYASMLAQAVGPRAGADPEESAICAMFRAIGRLMIALYEGECFAEIRRVATADGVSEAEAARLVMGVGFEPIGQRILTRWGIPEMIVKTVAVCAPSSDTPRGKVERLQLVSQFASEVAAAVCGPESAQRAGALATALSTYGVSLKLDPQVFEAVLESTSDRTHHFARALDLEPAPADLHVAVEETRTIAAEIELPAARVVGRPDADTATPGDRPNDSTVRLLAGLQDMTTGLAEGHDASSVVNIAIETLYSGLGYQRALLCLRDPQSGAFRARIHFGYLPRERLQRFAFPGRATSDLFWSVMQRNVDVHIRDVSAPSIHAALPSWYQAACPDAKSFVLLPLAFKQKPIGFFYADRPSVDDVGLTEEELALVRMLKGQTLIALRTAAARPGAAA